MCGCSDFSVNFQRVRLFFNVFVYLSMKSRPACSCISTCNSCARLLYFLVLGNALETVIDRGGGAMTRQWTEKEGGGSS